jgi:hypothetical protein
MRKILTVVIILMSGVLLGARTASKSESCPKQPQMRVGRCSPAFPGTIPQCGAGGSTDGSGTTGSGGSPPRP